MPISVTYATLPFYSLFDRDKQILPNGKLYFEDQNTRAPKPVYANPDGTGAYSYPLDLDAAARVPPLYFEIDSDYYIEFRNSSDVFVWSIENFTPPGDGSTPVTVDNDFDNLIINGQFRFFEQAQYLTVPKASTLIAAPNFYFESDGSGATDQIDFVRFGLDTNESAQTSPDATPTFYFKYTCSVAGSGETYKDLVYEIQDVRSLQGESCAIHLGMASLSGGDKSIEVLYSQYFGTGGSPSATVTRSITTFTITSDWADKKTNFTLDALTGKQRGTNNDDKLRIIVRMPLNVISEIGVTNFYLKRGNITDEYPYKTYDETRALIRATDIPEGTKEDNYQSLTYITSSVQDQTNPNFNGSGFYALVANPPVATMLFWLNFSAPPPGFLICDGSIYPHVGLYGNLFNEWSYNFTSRYGFSIASSSTDKIITYADDIGTVSTANSSSTSGITLSTTTPGSASARQVVEMTFKAASHIDNLSTVKMHTPNGKFLIWVNKETELVTESNLPFETNYKLLEVKIGTGDSATQVRDKFLAQLPLSGFASINNFTATVSTNVVTVTNQKIGVVKSSPSSGTSGFTIVVTTTGSATTYEKTTITCTSASSLSPGNHCQISTNSFDCILWLLIDGIGTKPSVSADAYFPIIVNSTDTSSEVATAIKNALHYAFFQLVDSRDMFLRMYSDATANDNWHYSVDGTKRASGAGFTTGEVAGSYQLPDIASHNHPPLSPSTSFKGNGNGDNEAPGGQHSGNGLTTGNRGGNETRVKNLLVTMIVKY